MNKLLSTLIASAFLSSTAFAADAPKPIAATPAAPATVAPAATTAPVAAPVKKVAKKGAQKTAKTVTPAAATPTK